MIKKILKRVVRLVPFFLIFGALAGSSYYFYSKMQKAQYLLQNPTAAAKEESDTLLSKVGSLMELPKGETPQVATIIDATKLKDQSFFANAMNGDKVIIYMNAKKAILYRPATNRIIEVEPLYIGQTTGVNPTPGPSTTPQAAPIRIALYNGTTTPGLTQTAQTNLTNTFASIQVVSKSNAAKTDYATTLIIDLTGKNADIANILAKDLTGTVTSLPPGELVAPNSADLLIILGKNYGK